MTKDQIIDDILTMIHNMVDVEDVKPALIAMYETAYKRGADSIRNSPEYSYREDMGR